MVPGSSGVEDGSTNPRPMRPLRRRRPILLTALVLAVALTAVACSGGSEGAAPTTTTEAPSTTTTLPPSTTTTITPDPARKVLLLGDSTMVDASPAVTAMLKATGAKVAMGAGPGFGLTRLGISDNPPTWDVDYPRILREEKPDLIIVMLGIWDQFYIENNGILAYARVVQKATDILLSQGAKVVYMAIPPGGKHPDRVQNGAFEAMAAMYPGQVFYIEYEGVLRGPAGDYPMTLPAADGSTLHLRKADAWHFCPDGAQRVAEELDRLGVVHGLIVPAAAGWQSGSWRSSQYYQEPACFA
jgi:hypothetical protein